MSDRFMGGVVVGGEAGHAFDEGTRRTEILQTAASLIATSGLRTSLQDIAAAAGILPGSLYHHFESKEAILVELLRRYHAELDAIAARTLARIDEPDPRPPFDRIAELGVAIASCAVANRAALQMSFYEGPSAKPELEALAQQRPTAILEAMLQTLRAAKWSGYLRADVDLAVLADRICQTMLQVGLDVLRHNARTDRVARLLCRIMLEGISARPLTDRELDRSAAFLAADTLVRSWHDDAESAPDDKSAHIRAVAKAEFGRRGYEGTTVRDIAAAAEMGTGTVYRLIGSKEELLMSIMQSFGEKVATGWVNVLATEATATAKIDALSWINTNALAHFGDEFRIQLAWMRQSPPNTANPGWLFATRVREMKTLLAEGIKSGDIAVDGSSNEMLARSVIGVGWVPENILHDLGVRDAHLLVRDTLLRGVTKKKR
ncbi:TetR/AcrR family transcriptional regulator [Mycobacterium sp. OTB74]|jgi:AcrR family transcriptional regulator|uniref:TetR/AcrR family transcriptional regulator n=1 Tax=Mycobacterium sp. OTB74 TaxID=1853452 RepID=UPI002474088C|nr:TetR/AcrR family transcriptional regulator [Mycobacterium sp. OTB74]MDH6242752.1 AcrR family transcriptional regulator [Mycobacterium sp. OTB74]